MTKYEDNMDFYNFIQYGQVSSKHEGKKRILEAQDIMTKKVKYLCENDSIDLFKKIAELEKIRHIPVVNKKNEVVGLLTHRDFFNIMASKFKDLSLDKKINITEIMKKEIKTISKDESLMNVARIMFQNNYGCLPVVEKKILIGIITANDFLKYFSQSDLFLNRE